MRRAIVDDDARDLAALVSKTLEDYARQRGYAYRAPGDTEVDYGDQVWAVEMERLDGSEVIVNIYALLNDHA